jgi:malonyl-CoA/methylmalonyl-CoA synthetase
MLTHDNLRSNALALVECWRFTADDGSCTPCPFHTTPVQATNVVLSGGSMIFLPTFDAGRVPAALGRATVLMSRPDDGAAGPAGLTAEAVAGVRLRVRLRRSWPRPTRSGASGPATPSSSATG